MPSFFESAPCPSCHDLMRPGYQGGGWFTWIPAAASIRKSMFKNMFKPSRQYGKMCWPFWYSDAAYCSACDIVLVSTARRKKGKTFSP